MVLYMPELSLFELFQQYGLAGLLLAIVFIQNWRVFENNKNLQEELLKVIENNTRALVKMEKVIDSCTLKQDK